MDAKRLGRYTGRDHLTSRWAFARENSQAPPHNIKSMEEARAQSNLVGNTYYPNRHLLCTPTSHVMVSSVFKYTVLALLK